MRGEEEEEEEEVIVEEVASVQESITGEVLPAREIIVAEGVLSV